MTDNKKPLEDDLDDLDDYLDEFQEDILSQPYEDVKRENAAPATEQSSTTAAAVPEQKQDDLSEEQVLESLLKSMGQESPEAKAQFESLLKDLASADGAVSSSASSTVTASATATADSNLKDTISNTLNRLKESGAKVDKSIKDEQVPGQDMLADLLAQLNMDGDGGDGDMSKLLNEMLGALASKEVLYEPLKDLDAKYPVWLKENKEKTTAEEYQRYEIQAGIVRAIVEQFESPDYSADNAEQQAFISKKLEDMQESGDPPKELMGDMDKLGLGGFGFDGDDIPPEMNAGLEKELEQNCQQQ